MKDTKSRVVRFHPCGSDTDAALGHSNVSPASADVNMFKTLHHELRGFMLAFRSGESEANVVRNIINAE